MIVVSEKKVSTFLVALPTVGSRLAWRHTVPLRHRDEIFRDHLDSDTTDPSPGPGEPVPVRPNNDPKCPPSQPSPSLPQPLTMRKTTESFHRIFSSYALMSQGLNVYEQALDHRSWEAPNSDL